MSPRTLLIPLVLVLGLGAFVWLYEREQPGTEERESLAKRVLGIEHDEVERLELNAGGHRVELVRSEQGGEGGGQDVWRIREPFDFAADYWQVDGLVRTLAELERVRELDDFDPAAVGLDDPRGRVVVHLEGGESRELRIGADVPASQNLIVVVAGESAASVVPAGTLWETIGKDPAEWREKDLFAAEREDVRVVTLERLAATAGAAGASTEAGAGAAAGAPGQDAMARALGAGPAGQEPGGAAGPPPASSTVRVRLERTDTGDFRLTEPIVDRADDEAVNTLLRELTGLRASEFLDQPPPLAALGLDPPAARLEVTLAEGDPFVLLWGARKEGAEENYAKVGDLVVTTTAALVESFDRVPVAWRSREWSSLPIYDVDQVTVTDAQGMLTLTREEGSWRRGEDSIEQGAVSDFLYEIDEAEAERIAEPGTIELAQSELTVIFATSPDAGDDGSELPDAREEHLELFAPSADDLVPARVSGRDAVLLLPRATRDEILSRLAAVRSATAAGEETETGNAQGDETPAEETER